jgi:acetyltransferase
LDVKIRPIKPEDELLEKEMFKNLSKQTQYFRFFGYIKDVTHEMLVRYTQIDYEREMALMAEVEEDGIKHMIGVVRIVNDIGDKAAEFAIVVADPWQGRGLGSKLTDLILKIAKENGIPKIYATVLKANKMMIQMFKKREFVLKADDMTTYTAELVMEK